MVVPFFDSTRQYKKIKKDIRAAIDRVFDSGKYVLGTEGTKLEENLAAYIGMKYGIGVNSGTDALKIALRGLGIGAGDEVITTTNTAVPTVSALRELGAQPVFVDIDDYFTLDPGKLEQAITKKTKAVVVVHLYGQAADIAAIKKITKKHGIPLIEDCAQSTGAAYGGKKLGSFGEVSCFSFYPTKNLGAYGDGGMILTSDKKLAEQCRKLRMYGMEGGYHARMEGFNSRLDELQAAILNIKLPHLDAWNARRNEIADYYLANISNPKVTLPKIRAKAFHSFHLFVVQVADRAAFMEHLKKHGIGAGIHYPVPIHLQDGYSFLKIKEGSLPASEEAARTIVSLPIFPELTDKELAFIVQTINAF